MTDEATQDSTYTMGYSADFQQLLDRRSVHTHGAHLLPSSSPGCGSWTLAVDRGPCGRLGRGGGSRRIAWD